MMAGKNRLSAIAAAALLALTLTLEAGSALADGRSRNLLGSWQATVTATFPPGLGPPLTSLITFSPGGGVVESRRLFVPFSPFGALIETAGHGQWVKRKRCRIAVKFVFLQQSFETGELVSTDTIDLDLKLERTENGDYELNGLFESVVEDLDGIELFRASGTYEAKPILVEAGSKADLSEMDFHACSD